MKLALLKVLVLRINNLPFHFKPKQPYTIRRIVCLPASFSNMIPENYGPPATEQGVHRIVRGVGCQDKMLYLNETFSLPCAAKSLGPADQLLLSMIQMLTNSYCSLTPPYPKDHGTRFIENGYVEDYDFIVVGAGSAGSIIAARLSEIAHWNVLLIEAGDDPPIDAEIPYFASTLLGSNIDWKFKTEKCNGCLKTGECEWPRGKVLGGSSTLNSMIYYRGNRLDFEEWVATGNANWDFDTCLKYFKRSEQNLEPSVNGNSYYHSKTGSMLLHPLGNLTILHKIFIESGKKYGRYLIDDINGDKIFGYCNVQHHCAHGVRFGTARSFLSPARNRPNLHITKHSYVTKVIMNNKKRAVGVEFTVSTPNGEFNFKARTKKEVIVSAGTVKSPQLLMLSGIGPKEHLEKHGISVIANSPVGKNMLDHVLTRFWFKCDPISEPNSSDSLYEYLTRRSGPMALPVTVIGEFSPVNGTSRPQVQIQLFYQGPNSPILLGIANDYNFPSELKGNLNEANDNCSIGYIQVSLMHPKSVGCIELNGTNAFADPLIYPNYFDHPDDLEMLLKEVKIQVSSTESEAHKSIGFKIWKFPIKMCDKFTYGSDQYWRCFIQYTSSTHFHPVGTCRMGSKNNPKSVVDSYLRVHGVKGLRVIDASVIPVQLSGNINAATMMVAERGAEFIIDQHGNIGLGAKKPHLREHSKSS